LPRLRRSAPTIASSERRRAKNLRVAARRRSSADCPPPAGRGGALGFAAGLAGLVGCPLAESGVARRGGGGAGGGFIATGFLAGAAFLAAGFLAVAPFLGAEDFFGADFLLGEMRFGAADDAKANRLAPALLPLFASAWSRNFIGILQSPLRPQ